MAPDHVPDPPGAAHGDLVSGDCAGPYLVEALCSRGGFASVYRARTACGAPVALKVLHASLAEAPSGIQRFRREAEAVQRMRHPAIVELVGFGDLPDGRPFLAFEWIDGDTLEEMLRAHGPLSMDRAVGIAIALCAGLAAAHRANVVHRDLKASNVMCLGGSREPVAVKLVDFGIAKLLDDAVMLTGTRSRIGTPAYMAPEQILGHAIGPAADVYALGVLLFQMVSGRLPFAAPSMIEVVRKHLDSTPPRASAVAPVSEAFADVIRRCLAKNPLARYANVDDLLLDLRAATSETRDDLFRADTIAAVALRVTVLPSADGLDLAWAARVLAAARRTCEARGFAVADDDERALLAVAELPHDDQAGYDARAAAVHLALAIPSAAACDVGRAPGDMPLTIAVHAAPVARLLVDGVPQYVGGDLLCDTWAASEQDRSAVATPRVRVFASDGALEGLERRFELGPRRGSFSEVVGARSE